LTGSPVTTPELGRTAYPRIEKEDRLAVRQQNHDQAGRSGPPLPTSHWTVFDAVRWPGRMEDRIDDVIVGPSGVHVLLHQEGLAEADWSSTATVTRAREAADAVGGLLPSRYRRALRPVICLCGTNNIAEVVDGVRLASPEPLRFALRHQPRVLSTSEVAEVSARLRLALTPYPAPPAPPTTPRLRRLWLRAAAAGLATAAAAAVLLEVGPGRLW
jgi:hypothetical protein